MRRPKCKSAAACGAVDTAVVIEIVLAVVLLAIDAVALHILGVLNAGTLAAGDHAISLGAVFHVIDALLAALQAVGLTLGQTAGSHALVDSAFLIGLALVNARRIGLGKSKSR